MSPAIAAEETILTPEERYIIARFAHTKWAAVALTDMICTMKTGRGSKETYVGGRAYVR